MVSVFEISDDEMRDVSSPIRSPLDPAGGYPLVLSGLLVRVTMSSSRYRRMPASSRVAEK